MKKDFDSAIRECPKVTDDHLAKLKEAQTNENFDLDLDIEHLLVATNPLYELKRLCDKSQERKWRTSNQRLLCTFCQLLHELPSQSEVVGAMSLYFDILAVCDPRVHSYLFNTSFFRATLRCLSMVLRQPKSEDAPSPQMEYKPLLRSVVRSLQKTKLGTSYDVLSYFLDVFANLATFPADVEVCDLAFRALTLILSNATSPRIVCSYVFRSILNAILMTQHKSTVHISKELQGISERAIKFVQQVAENYPDLLIPSAIPTEIPTENKLPETPGKPLVKEEANVVVNTENEGNVTKEGNVTVIDDDEDDPMQYDPYLGLIEYMCIHTPDRQDYRQYTQDKVMQLIHPQLIPRFHSFIQRLSNCDTPSRRTIACDMCIALIEKTDDPAEFFNLLSTVVNRTNDAFPTVRCKALNGVATGLCALPVETRNASFNSEHPHYIDVAQIFIHRACDKKPVVRKASLTFLDQLLEPSGLFFGEKIREILISLAQDTSVSVRKSALQSFANMLQHPLADEGVVTDWSKAILPSIADAESSVSEKASELIAQEVFHPIVALPNSKFDPKQRVFAILAKLDTDGIEFLQRSLTLALKNKEFKPEALIKGLEFVLQNCLDIPVEEWVVDMWSLLEELTAMVPEKVNARLIMQIWERIKDTQGKHGRVLRKTLVLLSNIADQLSKPERESLLELENRILTFSAIPEVIRDIMKVLAKLREGTRGGWNNLLHKMEDPLMLLASGEMIHPELSSRILFTLGEIALAEESVINDRVLAALKAIVSNAVMNEDKHKIELRVRDRAHGLAALGKLCLRREQLAKEFVEIFVHHLNPNEPVPIRANAVIALGDLAVHYTSLVDRFVPMMTDCLRDKSVCLRLQACMTIASLLAEEFIKFKGATMFRLVYGLSDPCADVRYFVESVFSRILMPRNPNVFANNFLDCICAMNNFSGLPSFQGALGNEDFSLLDYPERRTMVYRFMLGKLPTEQRFIVSAGIVQDILAAFTEGEYPLPIPETSKEPLAAILTDSLALLCCSELKVCFRHSKQVDEVEEQLEEEIKQKAVLSVLKQNVTDNIVPVLLALRTKLQNGNSPFLRDVTVCIREILRDFKDNIAEVVQDVQLVQEIRFDMGQLEDGAAVGKQQRQALALIPLSMREGEISMAEGKTPPTKSPAVSSPFKFATSGPATCPNRRPLENAEQSAANRRRYTSASVLPRRLSTASRQRVAVNEEEE